MAIKYLTFCLIIYFLLICNANSQENQRHVQILEKVNYNTKICSIPKYNMEMKENIKKFKCNPVKTVVHLYPKEHNVMINPDKVMVNRCYHTGCYGRNSCVAKNTREIPIAVHVSNTIPYSNPRFGRTCGWAYVTEHVDCTCNCLVDKDKCEQEGKLFNGDDCTCKCANEMERKIKCHKQTNMIWNEDTCTCGCTKKMMECTTGTEWVPKFCDCMKIMM